jgi:thiamine-monophosphate kinase
MLQDNEKRDTDEVLINRHLRPLPRVALGRELAAKQIATSMIDVSDGLLLDLERITVRQGVGARIELLQIPTSKEYGECIRQYSDDYYELALSGGEDYELLFTTPPDRRADIQEISKNLNLKITEIGYVTKDNNLQVLNNNGEEISLKQRGFVHFNN